MRIARDPVFPPLVNAPGMPIDDSYVLPGGLGFAGQYPGDLQEETARRKIGKILDAGVTVFIDLTEEGEIAGEGKRLLSYLALLKEEADRRSVIVEYQRHAVRDQHPPKDKSVMRGILDALDDAERRGKRVYLHCWGGKGRTGTAVACHLVRRGHTPDAALCTVQELARAMPKARYARIPESDDQCRFVRQWTQSD